MSNQRATRRCRCLERGFSLVLSLIPIFSEPIYELWSYSHLVEITPSSSVQILWCCWLEVNFLGRRDGAGQLGWTCRTLHCHTPSFQGWPCFRQRPQCFMTPWCGLSSPRATPTVSVFPSLSYLWQKHSNMEGGHLSAKRKHWAKMWFGNLMQVAVLHLFILNCSILFSVLFALWAGIIDLFLLLYHTDIILQLRDLLHIQLSAA